MSLFDNIKGIAGRKSKDSSINSRPIIYSSTFNKLNRKFGNREKATSYLATNQKSF